MPRQVRPAAGHPDAVAALGQRPHDVAADKARAADKGYNLLRIFRNHKPRPVVSGVPAAFSAPRAALQRALH